MTDGFGRDAVSLARSAVMFEAAGAPAPVIPSDPRFIERSGAFVTLSTFPDGSLRGCIGFPMPVLPLGEAIVEAGRSACHDPRFPDLRREEVGGVTVEVTILSVPERIRADGPQGIMDSIAIGRDGLMLELHGMRGLFLPQVPVEQGWDVRRYLSHLGLKAGLTPDAWMSPDVVISRFTGEIWTEEVPGGPARRVSDERYRCRAGRQGLRRRRDQVHRGRDLRGGEDRRRRQLRVRRRAQGGAGDQPDHGARVHRSARALPRSRDDGQGGLRDRDDGSGPCRGVLRVRHAKYQAPRGRCALVPGEEGHSRQEGCDRLRTVRGRDRRDKRQDARSARCRIQAVHGIHDREHPPG